MSPMKLSLCGDFTACRYEEGVFWHCNPSDGDQECNSAPPPPVLWGWVFFFFAACRYFFVGIVAMGE